MNNLTIERKENRTDENTTENVRPLKTRLQFDMPPRALARLDELKDITEASSYAEVVRNALRIYSALVKDAEVGKQFYIDEGDGKIVPYRIFV